MLFTVKEWKDLLLRSVGLEPSVLGDRTCDVMLLRMVPFVENNYNAVELGPRGTGKSHLYQQVSPYAHLVSGGKATVAKMFVNNANGQRGLVANTTWFFRRGFRHLFRSRTGEHRERHESGNSVGQKRVSALAGWSGGNSEVDVEHQQRIGHLLDPRRRCAMTRPYGPHPFLYSG
jgi:ATP-dependent Lon protease